MSKKLSNKTLLIVFIVLLALFLLTRLLDFGKNDRNFRTDLITLDTAQITSIRLYPREEKEEIKFTKEDGRWQVQKGNITASADQQAVKNLLSTLQELKPQRLASRSPEKWNTFEVTDSLGTRIQVMNQDKVIADLLIGKFSLQQMASQQNMPPMQQPRPKATSYVRLAGNDEVYAVDGFLTTTFNRQFNSWRDRRFLQLDQTNISKISFTYPADSGFVAVKADSVWMIGNVQADSAAMGSYLNRLSNLSSTDFADDFAAEGKQPQFKATVEGEKLEKVTVEGYESDNGFVLVNSRHPEVFIRSDSAGLFSQVFVGKEKLAGSDNE